MKRCPKVYFCSSSTPFTDASHQSWSNPANGSPSSPWDCCSVPAGRGSRWCSVCWKRQGFLKAFVRLPPCWGWAKMKPKILNFPKTVSSQGSIVLSRPVLILLLNFLSIMLLSTRPYVGDHAVHSSTSAVLPLPPLPAAIPLGAWRGRSALRSCSWSGTGCLR